MNECVIEFDIGFIPGQIRSLLKFNRAVEYYQLGSNTCIYSK